MNRGDLTSPLAVTNQNELGTLAQNLYTLVTKFRNSIETLEQQVAYRTKALKITAEISRQITTILEIDNLLEYVVARLQSEFRAYHVQVYLLNEESQMLIAHQGYGEVGQWLQQQHHAYKFGEGVVGQVGESGQTLLINDVATYPNFVINPLLPHTQAKLVVPLCKGEQLLGVLDILSQESHSFSEVDVLVVQAIADQVAIALNNLRQFAKTQVVLDEVGRLNRRLTRESWQNSLAEDENPTIGYEFKQGLIKPLKQIQPVIEPTQSLMPLVSLIPNGGHHQPRGELAVPLMLRGEQIGLLKVKRTEKPQWRQEELTAIDAVANQVSLALENVRLSTEQEKTIIKLQDLDRLKSEFLTSMSHELRTPLNAILGFADVLIQGIDGELTDYALNDIQLIYSSGQHLLTLINDILDISKIEAGMMEVVPEPLDALPIVREVIAGSESLVKNKQLDIIVNVPEHQPEIYVDSIRLKQILLNLVGNAAKFTEKGSITIKTFISESEPDKMRFVVIDTGIGIPKNKQEAIFERFKQADMSTTRVYGGTGLGLAICKQLVEMHNGRIWVESQESVGSQFHFTIPLALNSN
jgi:signal transduction histidine kinase